MKHPILLNSNSEKVVGFIEMNEDGLMMSNYHEVVITPIGEDGVIAAWSVDPAPPKEVFYKELKAPDVVRAIDDDRPITMITFPFQESDAVGLAVGGTLFDQEVTKIVAYEEPGEMGSVTWYAIYGRIDRAPDKRDDRVDSLRLAHGLTCQTDELIYRIQAKYVESIGYQEGKE